MAQSFIIEQKNFKNLFLFNPDKSAGENDNSILLEVKDNKIEFKLASSSFFLRTSEEIENKGENFNIYIPFHKLRDIVKNFSGDQKLSFERDKGENKIIIKSNNITYSIKTLEENILISNSKLNENEKDIEVDKSVLLEQIKKVKMAMGDDELRYFLNGISIEILEDENKEIHIVSSAINGTIIGRAGKKEEAWTVLQRVTLPKKLISEIISVLENTNNDKILLGFSDSNLITIKTDKLQFTLTLMGGTFPDCDKLIPYSNDKEVVVEYNSFKNTLAKIVAIENDKEKGVKFNIKENSLFMEIVSQQGNAANSSIEVEYSGEAIEIKFNAKYLLDIVNQLSGEKFILKIKDNVSSVLIYSSEDADNSLYVIMPQRLS